MQKKFCEYMQTTVTEMAFIEKGMRVNPKFSRWLSSRWHCLQSRFGTNKYKD